MSGERTRSDAVSSGRTPGLRPVSWEGNRGAISCFSRDAIGTAACSHLRLLQCLMGQEGERRRTEDGEVEAIKTNLPDCKFVKPKILAPVLEHLGFLGTEGMKGTSCPL